MNRASTPETPKHHKHKGSNQGPGRAPSKAQALIRDTTNRQTLETDIYILSNPGISQFNCDKLIVINANTFDTIIHDYLQKGGILLPVYDPSGKRDRNGNVIRKEEG